MRETNCCVCGVKIYFDDDYYNTLVSTHKGFYCVNGHSQSFIGKTTQEKIIEGLKETMNKYSEEKNKQISKLEAEKYILEQNLKHCKNSVRSYKGNITKIKVKHNVK